MTCTKSPVHGLAWPAAVAAFLSLSGLGASVIVPIRPRPSEPPAEILRDAFHGENSGPAHVYCVAFSPNGRYFLAGGDAGGRSPVRIYDGWTGKLVSRFLPAENVGWSGGRFSPNGTKVVSWGSSSATLYIWESATGREILKLVGHKQPPSFAAFSPDQKRIVSGSADRTLRVWDASTGKELLVLDGHTDACGGCFSPDGKRIVSFSNDKTVRGWDVATGKEVWKQSACLFFVNNDSFSPDGRVLSLGSDGSVRVFEVATGKVVANLKGPADAQGAAFVQDGQQLVWWAKDKTLRVWDMARGKVVRVIELGGDLLSEPDNVTVSPDGSLLLTGHTDQTVRIRDLATGKELHRFGTAPRTGTRSLAISPNARFAVAGSFRGWVYLWRLPAVP